MKRKTARQLITQLKKEPVNTWFDLCLYLDRVKDFRPVPSSPSFDSYDGFKNFVRKGIGFITYYIDIDGVTIEKIKYARSLTAILKKSGKRDVPIHWIAGHFAPGLANFADPSVKKLAMPGIDGFDKWGEPYFNLFHTKLERGGEVYNELPPLIWKQTLDIVAELGEYIEKNKIHLLLVTNTHSNPGNLSMSLAIVLLSEFMGIPVICSNHDFYWEGGKSQRDRKPGEKGARDHFFTNSDIGEVFSFQQVLYPWDSRTWQHVNINSSQSETLIQKIGISPANVMEMTTAVDTNYYKPLTPKQKQNVFRKMNMVMKSSFGKLETVSPDYDDLTGYKPVVFGPEAGMPFEFSDDSLILLQPTRVVRRKRIQQDIALLEEILSDHLFVQKVKTQTIFLVVTGPVAPGHDDYLLELQGRIKKMFDSIGKRMAERVRVAFFFGTKIESFRVKDRDSMVVPEVYGVSRLILLPSETEGRGLPIIESASAGVPIAPARYSPENVYMEVIGENRPDDERFQVLEFPEGSIRQSFAAAVVRAMLDEKSRSKLVAHNRAVVQKRYSYPSLKRNFDRVLKGLWLQTRKGSRECELARDAIKAVHPRGYWREKAAAKRKVICDQERTYLPGYAINGFLLYLKSLIDPSYFRAEEQELRSRLFSFALELIGDVKVSEQKKDLFFNSISRTFLVTSGKEHIGIDHSFNYRHRTSTFYPYRELTEQELKGVIVLLARKILGKSHDAFRAAKEAGHARAIGTWRESCGGTGGTVPSRGDWFQHLRLMVSLQPARTKATLSLDSLARFRKQVVDRPCHLVHVVGDGAEGLAWDMKVLGEELLGQWLERESSDEFSVTFAAKELSFAGEGTVADILGLLKKPVFSALRKWHKKGLFRVVPTGSRSAGTNLCQASAEFRECLLKARDTDGVVTARGEDNYFTLSLLDVNAYWFGTMSGLLGSKISGIERGSDYFFRVPAGLRPTLSYPTPVQNAVEFDAFFKSGEYSALVKRYGGGEAEALAALKQLCGKGLPLAGAVRRLANDRAYSGPVRYTEISGVYKDGLPWGGCIGLADLRAMPLEFVLADVERRGDTVLDMIGRYEKRTERKVEIAWNGGYILNAELVGKLGLPETYIGTPLGLLIKRGTMTCMPLFDKPAFGVREDGSVVIERVTLGAGSVRAASRGNADRIEWNAAQVNPSAKRAKTGLAVYNLLYGKDHINGVGRVVVEIAGDRVTQVARDQKKCELSPIGISISIPQKEFDKRYAAWCKEGTSLAFKLEQGSSWKNVVSAVEAGPLLIQDGEIALDMDDEGWNLEASIRIQAARLDRLDLRGPKIGVGLTAEGNVVVVAINGRTRESVGTSLPELAQILLDRGAVSAMGFDPGGSTTMVTQGVQRNISPYNKDYEDDPYTLPPVPRGVTNAILGVRKN